MTGRQPTHGLERRAGAAADHFDRVRLTPDGGRRDSSDPPAGDELDRLMANRAVARGIARLLWEHERRRIAAHGPRGSAGARRREP